MDGQTNAASQPAQISAIEQDLLKEQVLDVLRSCYDPEIPVDIFELGLIYDVNVDVVGHVVVTMTLTSPHCPAAQSLPREIDAKIRTLSAVKGVTVRVVWEPTWNPSMMTEAARLTLGLQ